MAVSVSDMQQPHPSDCSGGSSTVATVTTVSAPAAANAAPIAALAASAEEARLAAEAEAAAEAAEEARLAAEEDSLDLLRMSVFSLGSGSPSTRHATQSHTRRELHWSPDGR